MAKRTFAVVCTLQWAVGNSGCLKTSTWIGTTSTDKTSRTELSNTVIEHAAKAMGATPPCVTLFLSIEPDEL
jgi:hypothetical protein